MHSSTRVRTLILVAAVGVSETARAAPPPDPCTVADGLYQAQSYDLAAEAYARLLSDGDTVAHAAPTGSSHRGALSDAAPCALLGSARVAAIRGQAALRCDVAAAYRRTSQFEKAREAYLEALAIDPTSREATAGLRAVLGDAESVFAAVQALADLGLLEEARAVLVKTIQDHPGAPVPERLAFLYGGHVPLVITMRGALERSRAWLVIAAALLTAPLLFLAFRRRIVPFIHALSRVHLAIRDFDKGATGLEIGSAVAALVREGLRPVMIGGEWRIDVVVGSLEDAGIPTGIEKLAPTASGIARLVTWLIPVRTLHLFGCAQRSESRGVGLTLSIAEEQGGTVLRTSTVWQVHFDPSSTGHAPSFDAYARLATPAACWVASIVVAEQRGG